MPSIKDDLYDLLMAGEQVAEDHYNHSTWKVVSQGRLALEDALVASVHESMHHVLNKHKFCLSKGKKQSRSVRTHLKMTNNTSMSFVFGI